MTPSWIFKRQPLVFGAAFITFFSAGFIIYIIHYIYTMRYQMFSFLLFLAPSLQAGGSSVALFEETRAMIYLMRYGYAEPNKWSSSLVTERDYRDYVSQAVIEFQTFAGLEQTGAVDNRTREMMERPRCGVRDLVGPAARVRRRKRFIQQVIVLCAQRTSTLI